MRIAFISLLTLLSLISCAQNPAVKGKGWLKNNPVPANKVPVANAGVDKVITLPTNSVTFFGTASDADGTITIQWAQVSGPSTAALTGSTTATLLAGSLVAGTYTFVLRVTDNNSALTTDTVRVSVNPAANVLPVANAGTDSVITLPVSTVSLVGGGTDSDGTISLYLWVQVSGPNTSVISSATSATASVSGLIQGLYTFSLTVTDNNGATSTDNVQVTVLPAPANINPIASAGLDQAITLPINLVSVTGSGIDTDGTIEAYSWEQVSGPSTATIESTTSATTSIFDLIEGVYQFRLTVTDDDGASAVDIVQITVNPAPNDAPIVDAGSPITVTLPLDSVTVSAVATDDGSIVSYLWTKLSGTGSTIGTSGEATTIITGLTAGTYRFQVLVTDNLGLTASDYVDITVQAAIPANIPPTANAGANRTITLPVNSTTLNGSGTDEDGTIITYAWTQVSGPNTATIENPFLASTLLNNLIAGTYIFRLTVSDSLSATGFSEVTVIVNPALNVLPVANAGVNQVITLPTSAVSFTGIGTDVDGTITNYLWEKISGTGGTITASTSANTNVTDLTAGDYVFQLTVTDNSGATATDQVSVKVNPAVVNIAPVANAGPNQTITLPTDFATLSGSGTDADGTISTYAWVKISGTGGTITSSSSASTGVTGLTQGIYIYQLTVTDNSGTTASDQVQITVNGAANTAPSVNAGTDQSITVKNTSVTATATDSDGTIVSYQWSRVSGPLSFTITSPTAATTTITGLEDGVYIFQVTVRDNSGATATDVIQITVSTTITSNGNITFTLATQSHVSAAITKYTDSQVVKTLFSDSIMAAGSHTINWNGTDDFGIAIPFPDDKYIAKVVSNNIRYDWVFTIGNNSDSLTGHTKHRGYYRHMSGLAFAGLYGYYCTGYSEGSPSIAKFLISKPRTKIDIFGPLVNPLDVNYVATDGIYVYWAFFDPNSGNNTGVFATRCSNDAEVIFTSGVGYEGVASGRYFPSVISYKNLTGSAPTGLAVQSSGNYLFIARGAINQINVLDKTTGAFVRDLTYTNVKWVHADGNFLWMISGVNTVTKHTVNADGTLSATILTIPATEPHSVSVNPAGTIVSVTEGGLLQQVKHYNASTGAATSTLGTAGGYYTSASVTNYKFMFTNIDGVGGGENRKQPFIAYQPDGSYWVNDGWNYRAMHYSSAGVFSDFIMFLGSTYSCAADPNNPSRVFWGFLEYKVDYLNKTWVLWKNWRARVSYKVYNIKYDMKFTSFPDGRTWGFITKGNTTELIELTQADTMRPTGIFRTGQRLEPDGRAMLFTRGNIGGTSVMNAYALTSYLGTNPTWSTTPTLIYRTPTITKFDPNSGPRTNTSVITSSGKVVVHDPSSGATFDPVTFRMLTAKENYHFGILNQGVNTEWFARNQLSTHRKYGGVFPDPGAYDVGNLSNDFGGGGISTLGRYVVLNHHHENWKNSQTNYFNLYLDNGIALGQYGTDRPTVGFGVHAASKMAGNALNVQLIPEALTGNMYTINGDESDHSALGVWKISNLSSIVQQDIVVNKVTSPVTKLPNIMSGVPFDVVLPTSVGNWTRSHPEDSTDKYTSFYSVSTSYLKYKKLEAADIHIEHISKAAVTKTVTANLGANTVTQGWSLTGKLAYPGNMPNGQNTNQYWDVLDANDKILIRFSVVINRSVIPAVASIVANGKTLISGTQDFIQRASSGYNSFEFRIESGVVTVTYAGYTATGTISDPTGSWQTPRKLRNIITSTATTGGVYPANTDIGDVVFTNLDIL